MAAFGLGAGICAPAQAQTYDTSDIFRAFDSTAPTGTLLDTGSLNVDLFGAQNWRSGFVGGQEVLNAYRYGQSVQLPWTTQCAMQETTCTPGDDPACSQLEWLQHGDRTDGRAGEHRGWFR